MSELKTAIAPGIEVPTSLLLSADMLIESLGLELREYVAPIQGGY